MSATVATGLTLDETAALTRRATRLSVGVAASLSLVKVFAWLASGSVAMLASLADSSLDLLASLATFFAVRYAIAPPDREHRYGHGKAEAFASLLQAGLVFGSAALVGREAVSHILRPQPVSNGLWDLGVMAISMVLTFGLVAAQSRILKQASSVAVSGDRSHYAADLGANAVAALGIGMCALTGSPLPDALAGLGVALWLVWGAIQVFRASSVELMDHELSDDLRQRIIGLMIEDTRVRDIHQLRTRASGPYVHIQMHATLDPGMSLVQAHEVMVAAENRVLAAFPAADIIIHPDPRGRAEPHGGPFQETHHKDSARQS
jgi:cation diffusion facilitator family transporter